MQEVWTATDIDVGAHLVRALFAHADGTPLTAAALLALARKAAPRDAQLARAVPLGIVPKLAVVRAFCQQYGYPDLSALVIDPAADAVPQPAASALVAAQLADFTKAAHAAVPARFKPRAERPADVAWYAYFRSHRAACDAVSAEGKQEIINLIMAGMDPPTALARVLAAQAFTKAATNGL